MTTGNTQTMGGQPRIRRSLALLCVAALLLGLWMPWAKAAAGDLSVTTVPGDGYSLATTTGVQPNVAPSTIVFTVTVAAGYSLSIPTVTPPTTPECTLPAPTVTDGGSGEKIYTYELTSATGFPTDAAVTVTGVELNPPPTPTIKLTFPANNDYTIYHGDQGGTEHQNFSGADFNFDLRLNQEKYAIPVGMTAE
ncbi:MAG: hypothetical protein RRY95_01160, partial [Oscillospiraceae bacterium]